MGSLFVKQKQNKNIQQKNLSKDHKSN